MFLLSLWTRIRVYTYVYIYLYNLKNGGESGVCCCCCWIIKWHAHTFFLDSNREQNTMIYTDENAERDYKKKECSKYWMSSKGKIHVSMTIEW